MANLRFLKVFLAHPDAEIIFIQVDETNGSAFTRAENMGYRRFQPEARLVDLATAALPADKRADALGVDTIYFEFPRANLAKVQAYMRQRLEGDCFVETGKRGSVNLLLAPDVSALVRRGLDELAE